jgi:hypothetical protein
MKIQFKYKKLILEQEISNPSHTSFNNIGKKLWAQHIVFKIMKIWFITCAYYQPIDKVR